MLAMLEARLEKNHNFQRKVACSRAPRGSQYHLHSIRIVMCTAIGGYLTKHPHPARRHVPQNFRLSHADGSASVLLAATLALAASGVPAGCGFQSFRLIEATR
jgi:hypothetical protein